MDEPPVGAPLIGVLALQGDFEAHGRVLRRLGVEVREVRVPGDLDGLDGLVLPGGESTPMTLGVEREGLGEELGGLGRVGGVGGIPIILASRNAFGRQVRSFEADLSVKGLEEGPLRGVFIRAPWIAEHGPDVEILAEVDGREVAARQGRLLAVAFHTELGSDDRVHRLFLADVAASSGRDVVGTG
jgi:5'-phosphate synthase pdxT subunit